MELAIKIIAFVITILIALTGAILDYFSNDQRTNKFKIFRKSLLIFLVISLFFGIGWIAYEHQKDEIAKTSLEEKNEQDSIKYEDARIRDSILLEKQIVETEKTQEVLGLNKTLNSEFQSKIELQNRLLNSQEKEIKKSRQRITDDFYVSFEVYFNELELQELLDKRLKIDFDFFWNDLSPNGKFRDSIFTLLCQAFGPSSLRIEFRNVRMNRTFSLNDFYFNLQEIDSPNKIEKGVDFFYNKESKIFKLTVRRMPISIQSQDEVFITLYDLVEANLSFSFSNNLFSRLTYVNYGEMFQNNKCRNPNTITISYIHIIHESLPSFSITKINKDDKGKFYGKVYYMFDRKLN